MIHFSVKGFGDLQHYKDRSPPWIKLYNKLLDDYEFGALPDASKAHLIAIWLLASRYENRIPHDPKWIARRINSTEDVDLDLLASSGFIILEQERSETLAECKQSACPERETERETETEKVLSNAPRLDDKKPSPNRRKKKAREYDPAFLAWWERYPRREQKGDAFDAYWTMRDGGHSAEALQAGADYAAEKYASKELEWIPLPATFLRREGFLEAVEQVNGNAMPEPPDGLSIDEKLDWWRDYGEKHANVG